MGVTSHARIDPITPSAVPTPPMIVASAPRTVPTDVIVAPNAISR
jgi:hypothetical protein